MSFVRLIVFRKCEKDAKNKVNSFLTGQVQSSGFMQNAVTGFISERVQGMFASPAAAPPSNIV
jgi:hypothetical protein